MFRIAEQHRAPRPRAPGAHPRSGTVRSTAPLSPKKTPLRSLPLPGPAAISGRSPRAPPTSQVPSPARLWQGRHGRGRAGPGRAARHPQSRRHGRASPLAPRPPAAAAPTKRGGGAPGPRPRPHSRRPWPSWRPGRWRAEEPTCCYRTCTGLRGGRRDSGQRRGGGAGGREPGGRGAGGRAPCAELEGPGGKRKLRCS